MKSLRLIMILRDVRFGIKILTKLGIKYRNSEKVYKSIFFLEITIIFLRYYIKFFLIDKK